MTTVDEFNALRREYEDAAAAYNDAHREAARDSNSWQRRHRDNRMHAGDDPGELGRAVAKYNAALPALREQYAALQALRRRAADAGRACGRGCSLPDCMGRAESLPSHGRASVALAVAWMPFCPVPTAEVDAEPLARSPLCHAHLAKYAKAKNKTAWLRRNRALVQAEVRTA